MIDDKDVTGELFTFAEEDHASYAEYTEAIRQLSDLIEIIEDPGAIEPLPLFAAIAEQDEQ